MIAIGLLAGAAGTLALDTVTYADILRSGRPQSSLPAESVKRLAPPLGLAALASDDETAGNRRTGAGALLGYGVGLGAAVAYAALRPAFRSWLPWPIAGTVLGLSTVVVSEGSATALGATDWSQWTASEWAADLVPRTIYGLTVAYVVERLATAAVPATIEAVDITTIATKLAPATPIDPVAIEADREVNPRF